MLLILVLVAAWCVLPFPLAVAVGRSFRNGATRPEPLLAANDPRVALTFPRPRVPAGC